MDEKLSVSTTGAVAPISEIPAKDNSTETYTFATTYLYHFEDVRKQVELGMVQYKRTYGVLKKFCVLEDEFMKGLKIVTNQENMAMKTEDERMDTYATGWKQCVSGITQYAAERGKYAQRIQLEVVKPMADFYHQTDPKRKALEERYKQYTAEIGKLRNAVLKRKAECVKTIEAIKEKDRDAGHRSHSKSMFSFAFSKSESQFQKAYEVAKRYEKQIGVTNTRVQQLYNHDIPALFTGLQEIERQRLESLKNCMLHYASITQDVTTGPSMLYTHGIFSAANAMNPPNDITGFIDKGLAAYGPTQPEQPMIYALPCSPDDIKAGRLEGNPNSVFKTTLAHCMKLQATEYPDMPVPRILKELIDFLEGGGAFQREGIFRVASAKSDRDEIKANIDKGDYNVAGKDPYAVADVLKEWLRELAEPLIPEKAYAAAVVLAKNKDTSKAEVNEFVNKELDLLTREVVKRIAWMAQAISQPENAEINKMTIENLAIVFAPSFLSNPSPPEDDPNMVELMENARHEIRFTALLLAAIPLPSRLDARARSVYIRVDPAHAAAMAAAVAAHSASEMAAGVAGAGADMDPAGLEPKKYVNSICEGWLLQSQENNNRNLSKRYFVLMDSPPTPTIMWFKNKNDVKKIGLSGIYADSIVYEDLTQPWVFLLRAGRDRTVTTHRLTTASPFDKQKWIREIKDVIQLCVKREESKRDLRESIGGLPENTNDTSMSTSVSALAVSSAADEDKQEVLTSFGSSKTFTSSSGSFPAAHGGGPSSHHASYARESHAGYPTPSPLRAVSPGASLTMRSVSPNPHPMPSFHGQSVPNPNASARPPLPAFAPPSLAKVDGSASISQNVHPEGSPHPASESFVGGDGAGPEGQ